MTLQSYLTLRLLKKVQIVEDGRILLRHEDLTICTIVKQGQRQVTRNLSKRKDSLSSRLAYLEKNDMIQRDGDIISVTHKGWHAQNALLLKVISFLICSILIPFLIAVLTSKCTVTTILMASSG